MAKIFLLCVLGLLSATSAYQGAIYAHAGNVAGVLWESIWLIGAFKVLPIVLFLKVTTEEVKK